MTVILPRGNANAHVTVRIVEPSEDRDAAAAAAAAALPTENGGRANCAFEQPNMNGRCPAAAAGASAGAAAVEEARPLMINDVNDTQV
jgi:hypothetical protein